MNKAVQYIFDLDGTISDPMEGIRRSMNYALQSLGFDEAPETEVAKVIGPPLDEGLSYLAPTADSSDIQALVSKYRERYAEVGFMENSIYEGVELSLRALNTRGFRLGVCTSKRVDFAEAILEFFGIRGLFEFVDGGDIGRTKGDQLSDLLSAGYADSASVMIGDRAIDIISAKKSQLSSIGVLWGYGSRLELSEAGADLLLERADCLAKVPHVV